MCLEERFAAVGAWRRQPLSCSRKDSEQQSSSLTFAAKPAFPAGRERIPSAVNTGDLNQGWVKT